MSRRSNRSAAAQIDLVALLTESLSERSLDSDEEKEALKDLSENEGFKRFCAEVEKNRELEDWEKQISSQYARGGARELLVMNKLRCQYPSEKELNDDLVKHGFKLKYYTEKCNDSYVTRQRYERLQLTRHPGHVKPETWKEWLEMRCCVNYGPQMPRK